ncbi:MAG: response regulator [Clostridiales Family XIII bacterium]|jgi:signal transduction histidine kinase/DNA-binding response OmpR family regulator|nr:response regulator [Clostridiales Family XIII bacterium]
MNKLRHLIRHHIFSEELPLDARMVNMVGFVAIAAAFMVALTRVFMKTGHGMVLVMLALMFFISALIYICNRFQLYKIGIWVSLILLGDVLFPVAFFLLGGADSGIVAYFVLSIVLVFLLARGKRLGILLFTHCVWIVICYCIDYNFPDLVAGPGGAQRMVDNIQSCLVAGFSIGIAAKFQHKIYLREKLKAANADQALVRQAELLRAVNDAAAVLLASDFGKQEGALRKGMEKMALCVEIDRMYIWKNRTKGGRLHYTQVYEWMKNGETGEGMQQNEAREYSYSGSIPEWEKTLSDGHCVNGPVQTLSGAAQERLDAFGVLSVLVVPIFLQEKFWGFVSFDDCRHKREFSQEEESILRSGSLMMVNALVHNEMTQNLIRARETALLNAKSKTEFLANMSHEMRTPMNAITGMTAMAKSTPDPQRKDYCLDKIESASVHLLGVINDILDMSKIEANKLELSAVDFDFEKMLQKVANVINFRMQEKKQAFHVRIDKDIPRVLRGDDQRIAQVVTNLLSNAVKFTPDQGTVRMEARLLKEENAVCTLQIEVSDTGIGISEEQQEKLFNSFAQADSGTARKYGGTGLGLAISKRIVEMMHGRIWIESALGEGAKFTFTMEAVRGAGETKRRLDPDVDWGNLRLFVLDGTPETGGIFENICAGSGISGDIAASAEQAAAQLAYTESYDVYFIDWRSAGAEAGEFLRELKKHSGGSPVAVMLTTSEWNEMGEDTVRSAVDKFLAKPLFPSAVTDCLNECFGGAASAEDGGEADMEGCFAGCRVLLAEDVEINREIVIALLEPTALAIDCAENGADALKKYGDDPGYDMILMDVQMPEMDGYEATRRIRALENPEAKQIPIIAMTANVFREDVEKCIESGMDDHIGKPLDLDELLKKLRKYLGVAVHT